MTETEYIEATNLAKIRIAWQAIHEVMGDYGPVSEVERKEIALKLSDLLDRCFAAIKTSGGEPNETMPQV